MPIPHSGLRGWYSDFTQWSKSSLRMFLSDPFASADLSTVPWGSLETSQTSLVLFCLDRQLEQQAATKVLLGEAGTGPKATSREQEPDSSSLTDAVGQWLLWSFKSPAEIKVPQRLPAATLVRHGQDKWMTQWMEEWLGSQAGRVSFATGRKGNWWLVSLRHSCQYCLMLLFTTWTMGWSTLLGNYTFQLA